MCVAFATGQQMIATGSQDGTVKVWDIKTRTVKRTLEPEPKAWIIGVAFDDDVDNKVFVSTEEKYPHPVTVWDVETGKPWSDDDIGDRQFVFGGRIWNGRVAQYVGHLLDRHQYVTALALSDDEEKMAIANEDRSIEVSTYREYSHPYLLGPDERLMIARERFDMAA